MTLDPASRRECSDKIQNDDKELQLALKKSAEVELDTSAGKVMWAEKSTERAKSLPAYLVRKVAAFDPLRGNGNLGYCQKCKKTATFLRSKWSPDLRRVLHDDGY